MTVGALVFSTACVEEQPAPQPLEQLTITAPTLTATYGDAIGAITPAYLPYQVQVEGLTCDTDATATSPVGVYPIVCSGGTFGDTVISYVDGSVTITPAPLMTTASSGDVVVGGADPVVTAPARATTSRLSRRPTAAGLRAIRRSRRRPPAVRSSAPTRPLASSRSGAAVRPTTATSSTTSMAR